MSERDALCVIYLDDEEINLIMFEEMFKKEYKIHTTTSPIEALTYIENHQVDIIITDQRMPVMTGVEFLLEIDKKFPKSTAKRVMISGYSQEGEINDALTSKLLDVFVSKPWLYEDLKEILSTL